MTVWRPRVSQVVAPGKSPYLIFIKNFQILYNVACFTLKFLNFVFETSNCVCCTLTALVSGRQEVTSSLVIMVYLGCLGIFQVPESRRPSRDNGLFRLPPYFSSTGKPTPLSSPDLLSAWWRESPCPGTHTQTHTLVGGKPSSDRSLFSSSVLGRGLILLEFGVLTLRVSKLLLQFYNLFS